MPSRFSSVDSASQANDVPVWRSPMSSLSACRGSTTAASLPSFQPSSEEQPRPTYDELKCKFSNPAHNHIPRPLPEYMALNRTDVELVSKPTKGRDEAVTKPGGRVVRNRDTVEVWLLGHRSTSPNLHRSQFNETVRGDSPKSTSPIRPPLMCNTVLSRTSTSSSQSSAVSTVFDIEPSLASCSEAESETELNASECTIPTNKPSTTCHTGTDEKSSANQPESEDEAKSPSPKRKHKRTPTMSIHDKLRAGMYTTVPLTPDNLHRYMDAYAVHRPTTPRSRRPRSETPSQPAVENGDGKSGWERMKESVRKMEREAAAAKEKEKDNGVAKWRVGVSAWAVQR